MPPLGREITNSQRNCKNKKTWPLSKFIIYQGHVLENANFDAGRQIWDFTVSQCFFSKVESDHVFLKIITKNAD